MTFVASLDRSVFFSELFSTSMPMSSVAVPTPVSAGPNQVLISANFFADLQSFIGLESMTKPPSDLFDDLMQIAAVNSPDRDLLSRCNAEPDPSVRSVNQETVSPLLYPP